MKYNDTNTIFLEIQHLSEYVLWCLSNKIEYILINFLKQIRKQFQTLITNKGIGKDVNQII